MASVKKVFNIVTIFALASVLTGLMQGCSHRKANYDYDQSIDFVEYESYRWMDKEAAKSRDPRIKNDLVDSRVRKAIDATLRNNSYVLLEEGDVHFLVSYQIGIEKRTEADRLHTGIGFGYRHLDFGFHTDTIVREYNYITLYIDMVDPKTGKLVWRGSKGYRYRDGGTVPERDQRMYELVRLILSEFPPNTGTSNSLKP